jgi:hypothetical protein
MIPVIKFIITITIFGQIFRYINGYVGDPVKRTSDVGESNMYAAALKLLTHVVCGRKVDSVIEVFVKQFCLANKKGI